MMLAVEGTYKNFLLLLALRTTYVGRLSALLDIAGRIHCLALARNACLLPLATTVSKGRSAYKNRR